MNPNQERIRGGESSDSEPDMPDNQIEFTASDFEVSDDDDDEDFADAHDDTMTKQDEPDHSIVEAVNNGDVVVKMDESKLILVGVTHDSSQTEDDSTPAHVGDDDDDGDDENAVIVDFLGKANELVGLQHTLECVLYEDRQRSMSINVQRVRTLVVGVPPVRFPTQLSPSPKCLDLNPFYLVYRLQKRIISTTT